MPNSPPIHVDAWLAALGFSQYAPLFAEHAIDTELLPTLSEADLRSLGLPFGHARKLAMAASQLRQAPPLSNPASEPERRQLTVMFCDLVGSTALSSRLDPEDLRDIVQRYQRSCGEVVARHGGFVAQYLGDGIMVYFGYPQAQEDAAAQAVGCGLGIIAAVGALEVASGDRIRVRLGAATGLAVVGDLIGRGASEQAAVIGQTPNLAARVQALAEADCMIIAESTRKLAGERFTYRDLGPQQLKGIEGEIRVYQVLGERSDEQADEARLPSRLACVGRQREIDFLREKWEQAKAGRGHTVLAWGEAGIGKSRLLRQLHEELADEALIRVHVQCSPQHLASPLYPIIQSTTRAMGLRADMAVEAKLATLEKFLARVGLAERLPVLAALLSIPLPQPNPVLSLAPDEQKVQMFALCLDFITALCARQPVLYQIEDAHWIDPTTEELVSRLVERVPSQRLLLIVTGRPECQPPWLAGPQVAPIDLGRLDETEIRMMVESIAGKALPEAVMEQILAKTDGVPLFIEQLTRSLLESGLLSEDAQAWVLSRPLPPMAIPLTLQDSLMARLDRLASAKEVIQVAAAIGRVFTYPMLAAVIDTPESGLRAALTRLCEGGLISARGEIPEAEYRFKHAMVQDVAYESLLKSRRAVLHTRIIRALETHFPDLLEAEPEVVAFHAVRADLADKAIAYGLIAGRRALARSANREALCLLEEAIALLDRVEQPKHRQALELELQLALGQAAMAHYGYAAPETAAAFSRARELAEAGGQSQPYYEILYGLYASNTINARFNQAAEVGQRFHELASRENDAGYLAIAHRMLGVLDLYRARLPTARRHLETALKLYDPAQHRDLALDFGTDLGVTVRTYLAWADSISGQPSAATHQVEQAIEQAQQYEHALSLAQALHMQCLAAAVARDFPALLLASAAAQRYCEDKRLGYFLFWANNFRAYGEAMQGQPASLFERHHLLAELPTFNKTVAVWWFHAWVAEAWLLAGQPAQASEALADARALVSEVVGETWGLAEIQRLQGECLLAQGAEAAAEQQLRAALATAQAHGTTTFGTRAALTLCRWLHTQGRREEAATIARHWQAGEPSPEQKQLQQLLESPT